MSTFTLEQGRHYHRRPPFSTLPWIGAQAMQRTVTFAPDCAYDSDAYHAQDVNKLFGLSFGLLPHRLGTVQLAGPSTIGRAYTTHKWVSALHWNSARFGWRWNAQKQCVDLLAYVYVNGVRNQDSQMNFPLITQVPLGQPVRCEIAAAYEYINGQNVPVYTFMTEGAGINSLVAVPRVAVPSYGLTHGLYFGGTLTAPHQMHVTLNRSTS